jgi:hypothetical protein
MQYNSWNLLSREVSFKAIIELKTLIAFSAGDNNGFIADSMNSNMFSTFPEASADSGPDCVRECGQRLADTIR